MLPMTLVATSSCKMPGDEHSVHKPPRFYTFHIHHLADEGLPPSFSYLEHLRGGNRGPGFVGGLLAIDSYRAALYDHTPLRCVHYSDTQNQNKHGPPRSR